MTSSYLMSKTVSFSFEKTKLSMYPDPNAHQKPYHCHHPSFDDSIATDIDVVSSSIIQVRIKNVI